MTDAGVIRIAPQRMAELAERFGHEDTPIVYHDRNVLVRELFWRRLDALLALSEVARRERVLDFGGGNGVLLPTLARRYQQVVCVDLHTEMATAITRSMGLANIEVMTGEISAVGLAEGSFDTIIAADVLEHVRDLPLVIEHFDALLRPGGELLVSAPSENRFYALGRRVFGYRKPHDHYYPAAFIERTVAERLSLARRRYFPVPVPWLAVFSLARFVKPRAPAVEVA